LDASAWAAIIMAGLTALLVVVGVAGYQWGKQIRAEDKAEQFGRLEGWADAAGTRRSPADSVAYSLGGLSMAVKSIEDDIKEIRRLQRDEADHRGTTRDMITRMQTDISSLRVSFQNLSRRVNQLASK
jgi:hypothetical protein